jgi:threonine/homoserine/homoserine lactone efflux protein
MNMLGISDFGLFLAGTLARRAGRSPRLKLWLERTVGASFIALGAKLALTRT